MTTRRSFLAALAALPVVGRMLSERPYARVHKIPPPDIDGYPIRFESFEWFASRYPPPGSLIKHAHTGSCWCGYTPVRFAGALREGVTRS